MTNRLRPPQPTLPAEQTARLESRDAAWAFMRECDDRGDLAGYPSLKPDAEGYYTVRYIPTTKAA